MPKITNTTRETLDFDVGETPTGERKMDHLRPGETKSMSIDLASAQVKGRLQAGLIRVESAKKANADASAGGAAA